MKEMMKKIIVCIMGISCVLSVASQFVRVGHAGQIQEMTISGRDQLVHSPLKARARTDMILVPGQIKSIEVRWKTKYSEQEAQGWLFLNGKEYDLGREILDVWRYDQWENLFDGQTSFQLGIASYDADDSNLFVDIDFIRVTYEVK